MTSIRISETEKESIIKAIQVYDADAKVYLFGSRADIQKKGGDIDLIIISDKIKKDDLAFIESGGVKMLGEQDWKLVHVRLFGEVAEFSLPSSSGEKTYTGLPNCW